MDKVQIKNLKISGKHGVYDFEKKQNIHPRGPQGPLGPQKRLKKSKYIKKQ